LVSNSHPFGSFSNVKLLPKNQPQITQINQNPKKISQATKKFHELQYCTKPKKNKNKKFPWITLQIPIKNYLSNIRESKTIIENYPKSQRKIFMLKVIDLNEFHDYLVFWAQINRKAISFVGCCTQTEIFLIFWFEIGFNSDDFEFRDFLGAFRYWGEVFGWRLGFEFFVMIELHLGENLRNNGPFKSTVFPRKNK
jgi:hypothetical protein